MDRCRCAPMGTLRRVGACTVRVMGILAKSWGKTRGYSGAGFLSRLGDLPGAAGRMVYGNLGK
jgi:hypothetical protein